MNLDKFQKLIDNVKIMMTGYQTGDKNGKITGWRKPMNVSEERFQITQKSLKIAQEELQLAQLFHK